MAYANKYSYNSSTTILHVNDNRIMWKPGLRIGRCEWYDYIRNDRWSGKTAAKSNARQWCTILIVAFLFSFDTTNVSLFVQISIKQLLLPAILELAADSNFRVRIMECLPTLAAQFGKNNFNEQYVHLCIEWLRDEQSAVREAALQNVTKLAELHQFVYSRWKYVLKRSKVMQIPTMQILITMENRLIIHK